MKRLFFLFVLTFLCITVNAQWVQQNSGTIIALQSVKAVNNNVIWAAGDNGVVLNTTDGGVTWNIKTPTEAGYNNYGIAANNINTAWVIGSSYPSNPYSAKIWKTTDGGNTWIIQYYAASNVCDNIHFFDSNNGVYLGDPNPLNSSQWNILTTTDGGNNWNRVPSSNYPPSDSLCGEYGIIHSYGADGDAIWFSTYYQSCPTNNVQIYRSTDRGYNWTVFDMPYKGHEGTDISFSTATNGVAISYSGAIAGIVSRTTDGGTTWTVLDTIDIVPWAVRDAPGYENFFLAVGDDGKSFYSNNFGDLWIPLSAPTQMTLHDVSLTSDNAWAVGVNGAILTLNISSIVPVELTSFRATTNGKEVILNWSTATELNNLGFEIQRSIEGVDFFTVGFVKGNGTTTELHNYSYADRNLNNGKYFYRLKQVDFNGTYEYSDVVEVDYKGFNSYLLEQNYPNPFNPTTIIGFGIQNKSDVKITILNSIGEEVAVLLSEEREPGYHTVEFNAANLPSGVYFYQFRAGSFVETKKMLLLK